MLLAALPRLPRLARLAPSRPVPPRLNLLSLARVTSMHTRTKSSDALFQFSAAVFPCKLHRSHVLEYAQGGVCLWTNANQTTPTTPRHAAGGGGGGGGGRPTH
ncbi:hypothetical protein E2C01_080460 [Portunus trituberculatus]|uniref:Uncharacterized protein n=1 Tax=Portunus trituberculatus TaxID=210409 RepID=A0A5B7IW70_PORTR|nr:hypothetical protein [Portunus trituberculatus]